MLKRWQICSNSIADSLTARNLLLAVLIVGAAYAGMVHLRHIEERIDRQDKDHARLLTVVDGIAQDVKTTQSKVDRLLGYLDRDRELFRS